MVDLLTLLSLGKHAPPQILVAPAYRAPFGEEARLEQRVASDRDRARPHRAFAHREPGRKEVRKVEAPGATEFRRDPLRLRAILEDMVEPRRSRAHVGIRAYAFGQNRQMVRVPQVIGIEEGDPVTVRRPDADIAPGVTAGTRRRQIEQLDPRVPEGGHEFAPAVGRSIIDRDDLMRRIALRERAFDRRADMRGLVVERHHHGKTRD